MAQILKNNSRPLEKAQSILNNYKGVFDEYIKYKNGHTEAEYIGRQDDNLLLNTYAIYEIANVYYF
jgi:hypothetical protein